jgi:hypothetical protein
MFEVWIKISARGLDRFVAITLLHSVMDANVPFDHVDASRPGGGHSVHQ